MRILVIILLFISTAMAAKEKSFIAPLNKESFKLKLSSDYQWKNNCKATTAYDCYQIWKEDAFLSLNIYQFGPEKPLKDLCKNKVKQNKHKLNYCLKDNVVYIKKDQKLIVISYSGKKLTKDSFLALLEEGK